MFLKIHTVKKKKLKMLAYPKFDEDENSVDKGY